MSNMIARYLIEIPPVLMSVDKLSELEPIRLNTSIGKVVIYPPGSKERKPLIEAGKAFEGLKVKAEIKDSPFWDANTLWVYIESEEPSTHPRDNLEMLDKKMRETVYRFLRLLRREIAETLMPIPISLDYSVDFDLGQVTRTQPFIIHVVPEGAGLNKQKWSQLQQKMDSGEDTELWEDFIFDSRVALEEGDLNRATINAAIGCEIFIKRYTEIAAKQKGISPVFWKYLTDPGTETRVLTYYSEILHLITGHSLKNENARMHEKLTLLFRARNKIVHEGKIPSSWDATEIERLRESIRESNNVISWVRGCATG